MYHIRAHTLCLLLVSATARADLLWDNGEFHGHGGLSCERDTLVPESWTVDDVIVSDPVLVRGFEWFTIVDELAPIASDMIVLDSSFNTVVELRDLPFTRALEGTAFGLDYYRVNIANLSIELDPGRYYLGARMVGNGSGRSFTGLQIELFGETEGYFRSEYFDWPDWVPISWAKGGPYDVSFKVYGDIIPAPATLAVLLPGLVAARRRR